LVFGGTFEEFGYCVISGTSGKAAEGYSLNSDWFVAGGPRLITPFDEGDCIELPRLTGRDFSVLLDEPE
jgi:hypothetical protein